MNLQDRTSFYQKLYLGIKSGLTIREVVKAQLLPATSAEAGKTLLKEMDKGTAIAKALTRAGLVTTWEAELIHIGESTGRLESVLARLEEFCSMKSAQLGQIKSKLVYPMMTLLAAVFLLPIPALANGRMSTFEYAVQVVISLLFIWFFYQAFLVKPFKQAEIGAFNGWLMKSLKFVGDDHFLRQIFEVAYLDLLTLCLESGMDAVNALKLMQRCSRNKKYQRKHAFAVSKITKSGSSLSETLNSFEILKSFEVTSFLVTSEASGTLHSELRNFIQRKQHEVDASVDLLLRRVGGAIYIGIVAYAALWLLPVFTGVLIPGF